MFTGPVRDGRAIAGVVYEGGDDKAGELELTAP